MLSKLLRPGLRFRPALLVAFKGPLKINTSKFMGLIPPNQYDVPIPNKLKISKVLVDYWETIPLFFVTFFAMGIVMGAIAWACFNKVDVVFSTRSRNNISRTMDLRDPTIHKIIIINQKYKTWPEMQDVLDKMAATEKRAMTHFQSCPSS